MRIVGAFYPPYFTPPVLIDQHEMDNRMDAGLDTFAIDIPRISSATCWLATARPSSSTSMRRA